MIYNQNFEYLLIRRKSARFWQSVTGSMEWHESRPMETAVREIAEETGIEVPPGKVRDHRLCSRFALPRQAWERYGDARFNLEHVFSCQVDSSSPIRIAPAEHSDWGWFNADEALATVWSWSNRNAIRRTLSVEY